VDSHFSLEPHEFRAMVDGVARAETMIGAARFGLGLAEECNVAFRRSLYVVRDLEAGEQITDTHVRSIRPGHGLSPRFRDLVIGRRAARAAPRGTPVSWDLVSPAPIEAAV
jgi:N-acetylneuraminate synthase